MGIIRLLSDVFHATRMVMKSRYRLLQKLRLIYDYINLRLSTAVAYRFGWPRTNQSLLGYKISFLDPSFFQTNVYEVILEENYYFKTDTCSPVIVDCGSNIGLTVLYFKHLYPMASIIAIEPQPRVFETLQNNIANNALKSVKLVNAALTGSEKSSLTLYHAPSTPGDMRATTLSDVAEARSTMIESVVVQAVKLSSLLPDHVDLLKIDVEGAELEILRELGNSLNKVKHVFMECHYNSNSNESTQLNVLDILENAGFRCLVYSSLKQPLYENCGAYYTLFVFAYRQHID
jgi:FkbM family methyltransferase